MLPYVKTATGCRAQQCAPRSTGAPPFHETLDTCMGRRSKRTPLVLTSAMPRWRTASYARCRYRSPAPGVKAVLCAERYLDEVQKRVRYLIRCFSSLLTQ